MTERRLSNSELKLQQLEEQAELERQQRDEKGILELFDDSDRPLTRDGDAEDR